MISLPTLLCVLVPLDSFVSLIFVLSLNPQLLVWLSLSPCHLIFLHLVLPLVL